MSVVWIAEKRKVAENIAAAIGLIAKHPMHFECHGGNIIAYAQGHLLEVMEPHEINPEWKKWCLSALPMLPATLPLRPSHGTAAIWANMKRLIKGAKCVVIATDPDREGELIGREIVDNCNYKGEVKRFWLKEESPAAYKLAISDLRPGSSTEGIYQAAIGRREADWLIGMNMTRGMTAGDASAKPRSVGRVQTPTLALIVNRSKQHEAFTPVPYFTVQLELDVQGQRVVLQMQTEALIESESEAKRIVETIIAGRTQINVTETEKSQAPPLPFSLSTLQQAANRTLGYSLKGTQGIAQKLKDQGLITYHRTDSQHLEPGQKNDVDDVLAAIADSYGLHPAATMGAVVAELTPDTLTLRSSTFDAAKVTGHPAITPTKKPCENVQGDAWALYELIALRYCGALSPDHKWISYKIVADLEGRKFEATTKRVLVAGWKKKEEEQDHDHEDVAEEAMSGEIKSGEATIKRAFYVARRTTPPAYYTEATLSVALTSIGQFVQDPAIRKRLSESAGIGRPSTHDAIVETLIARGYIARRKKHLIAQPEGLRLITEVLPVFKDPTMTAVWELRLDNVANGKMTLAEFREKIRAETTKYITQQIALRVASA